MARPPTGTVQWFGDHWRARVTLADGSRPWLNLPPSIGRNDEAKAREKARELAAYAREHGMKRANEGALVGDGETVSDFCARWIEDRRRRGIKTCDDDAARLRKHFYPLVGSKPIRAVDAKDLRAFVAALDEKIAAGALAWKSASNLWGLVGKLFTDAQRSKVEALRVREDNPASGVAPPDRGVKRSKAFLYPDEFAQLVRCTAIPKNWRRIYALAVYTYAREGELDALHCEDIDLERGVLHIHRARDRDGNIRETKGRAARELPIEPNVLPLLRAMVRACGGEGRIVEIPRTSHSARGLRHDLQLAGVERAALYADDETRKAITFHDLRATGITWRAARGDDAIAIQLCAGHTDLNTTQHYIRSAASLRSAFTQVFGELPPDLLCDDTGGPGGGGFRPRESSDRRTRSDKNPVLSAETRGGGAGSRTSHASFELEKTKRIRDASPSPTPPNHPGSPGSVQSSDDCGTDRERIESNPRRALVAALGEAVRAGLEGGDALLVRVAAKALAELVDPSDGPVIDLATERARRG